MQIGALTIVVIGLVILYGGSFLGLPPPLVIGLIIVAFGVYLFWFFRTAFPRYRQWMKEWQGRP